MDSKLPPATVRVRVLGWDGTPIRGATIDDEETNAEGEVLLTDIPPGERLLEAHTPGRLGIWKWVDLASGATHQVTLREPFGGTLEVLVTDEKGRPRPSAHIQITGSAVFDVVDGVQRLDRFTDASGRRTFARAQPGSAWIRATWGSRGGTREVEIQDGETSRVTIVAK